MTKKNLLKSKRNLKLRGLALVFIVLSGALYFLYNSYVNNSFHEFVSNNLIIQSLFLCGTLYTFLSPFINLSFTKKINKNDIITTIEQKKEEDKLLVKTIKEATIG